MVDEWNMGTGTDLMMGQVRNVVRERGEQYCGSIHTGCTLLRSRVDPGLCCYKLAQVHTGVLFLVFPSDVAEGLRVLAFDD